MKQAEINSEVGSIKENTHGLRSILALHNQHTNFSDLSRTFGDGFLCATSNLFKNVRNRVTRQGYFIVNETSEQSRDILMTGIYQLEHILFDKKIYARQNAQAIKLMVEKFDQVDVQLSEIVTQEAYSSVFHESIHCLIKEEFGWKSLRLNQQKNPSNYLLQLFIGEAVALTFEYLLCAQYTKAEERAIVLLNALGRQESEPLECYRQLKTIMSEEEAALWIFRGYFASNYFYESSRPVPGLFQTIDQICKVGAEDKKEFSWLKEEAFKAGFFLNKAFRNITTYSFYKLIGGSGDLKEAFQFDIYQALHPQGEATRVFLKFYRELLSEAK